MPYLRPIQVALREQSKQRLSPLEAGELRNAVAGCHQGWKRRAEAGLADSPLCRWCELADDTEHHTL